MRFVVISAPRSGSTYLTSYLSLHNDIWCHDEVFHPARKVLATIATEPAERRLLSAELLRLRANAPFAFLEAIYGIGHDRRHVGFKIFPAQDPEIINHLIANDGVRKVVLFRSNLLARHASSLAASQTSTWGETPERPAVRFVPGDFIRKTRRYQEHFRRTVAGLQQHKQSYLFLRTDELTFGPKLEQLFAFLGAAGPLPQWDNDSPWVRGPSDVISRFSNPEEVTEFLREHGLMHLAWESDLTLDTFLSRSSTGGRLSRKSGAL
jgi:hypothetical protein